MSEPNKYVEFDDDHKRLLKSLGKIQSSVIEELIQRNKDAEFANTKRLVDDLDDEQRLDLFSEYCLHCGGKKLPCNCMRDE